MCKIKRIILYVHGVIGDWGKEVLFEYGWPPLSWVKFSGNLEGF